MVRQYFFASRAQSPRQAIQWSFSSTFAYTAYDFLVPRGRLAPTHNRAQRTSYLFAVLGEI